MSCYVGIDGGGTSLRVAVVDAELRVLAEAHGETVNPSVVGHALAAQRIQAAVQAALSQANVPPRAVAAVGVGVAGAAPEHSAPWLSATLGAALPDVPQALASDVEVALVGAHGARLGLLVLSGTGSCAYGVNAARESALVGGWGYLLGDEGSGCWIGRQALKCVAQIADQRRQDEPSRAFKEQVLDFLEIRTPRQMLQWVYREGAPAPRVATLAPLVLAMAQAGNAHAQRIVTQGALRLVDHVHQLRAQLGLDGPIGFAGGLLEKSAYYRQMLADALQIDVPTPRYPPVIGAALLAKLTHEREDDPC